MVHAIIVAAGVGSRMGNAVPKQFLPLAGKPLLYYSIKNFIDSFSQLNLVVVVHPEYVAMLNDVLNYFNPRIDVQVVMGGATRYQSVANGVAVIKNAAQNDVVMIHDAARPFAMPSLLNRLYAACLKHKAVIPVMPMAESVRKLDGELNAAVPREQYVTVQTPQCFIYDVIKDAYAQEYQSCFTDDATVVEGKGQKIALIEGLQHNIKITTPLDFNFAELLQGQADV